MWGLKTLGRGLITILISPLLIAFIALVAIYGLVVYLIYEVSSIYLFFLGKNINSDDEETAQLKTITAGIEPGYYRVEQNLNPIQPPPVNNSNETDNGGNNNA